MNDNYKNNRGGRKWWLSLAFLCLPSILSAEMASMQDAEMSNVAGQALFVASKQTVGSYNFYRMGFDASLELNANIKELRLGETFNGTTNNADIIALNVALGCIANASNTCVDSTSGTGTQLKPFTMLRPYIQVAVKNDGSRATREVVGIRLGAENVSGPMSIGNFEMFSGYLSATANIEMQEQGKGRNPLDVAVTCGPTTGPCPNAGTAWNNGVNTFGLNEPDRSLGLNNDQACFLSLCAQFRDLAVNYDGVLRSNLPVVLNGRRQNQAMIQNLFLADAVDQISNSLSITRSNSSLSAGLINFILPILAGNVSNKIKAQLATGLSTTTANLNTYQMPYNVQNLHQADINSPLFGLSFQKEAGVQYPGYVVAMQKGWSMYLPNAFTLSVSQPTTIFVSNIMSGAAREGNVVQLPVGGGRNVYDNCWGTPVFC
jgi:hypothetical protein